jgi:hypothetical protein
MARNFIFLISLMVLVVACSSAHKRAEKLMKAESYEEAMKLYEGILNGDPSDEKAQIGLRKAREKVIDRKLIQVRKTRMGGNVEGSLNMLKQVIDWEDKWSFFPGGAVAFTQKEEMEFATRYLNKNIERAVKKNLPLRGSYLLHTYQKLYGNEYQKKYSALKDKVSKRGLKRCKQMQKGKLRNMHYYGGFLRSYCGYYGVELKNLNRRLGQRKEKLFSDIKVDISINQAPASYPKEISDKLRKALKKTAWYWQDGPVVLQTKIHGDYNRQHSTNTDYRTHSYMESVQYTEYVDVDRDIQEPYQARETQYNPATKAYEDRWVTKYRTRTITERQPETRYRDEPRTYNYTAINHHQVLELSAALEGRVLGKYPIRAGLNEKLNERDSEHSNNLPHMGLAPDPLRLTSPDQWLSENADKMVQEFETNLVNLWKKLYCRPSAKGLIASGENVHKCLRQTKDNPPKYVEAWYNKRLGVSVAEAYSLL